MNNIDQFGETRVNFADLTFNGDLDDFKSRINEIVSDFDNLRDFEEYVNSQTFYYEQFEDYYSLILQELLRRNDKTMIIDFLSLDLFNSVVTSFKFNLLAKILHERE